MEILHLLSLLEPSGSTKKPKNKTKTNRLNQKRREREITITGRIRKKRKKKRYVTSAATKFSCEPRQTSFDPVTMELLIERMIHPVPFPSSAVFPRGFCLCFFRLALPAQQFQRQPLLPPSPTLPTLYYVTSHYAPNPAAGTLRRSLLCRAGWLMFCGRIPAVLSSRNKDFVCRARDQDWPSPPPDIEHPSIG